MLRRVLLLAVLTSGAFAAPMTYTITGIGSGSWNSQPFTDVSFTFIFTSDTATIVHGTPCCSAVDTTPAATAATVLVNSFVPASLSGDQAIFLNRPGQTVGIWHYNSPDYLTIAAPQFAAADLTTPIASAGGTTFSYVTPIPLSTGGTVYFTSVHDVIYSQQPGSGQVSTISVTPNGATVQQDTMQTFTVVVADSAGASDIGGLDLLLGDTAYPYACWLYFNAVTNSLQASHRFNWGSPSPVGPSGSTGATPHSRS